MLTKVYKYRIYPTKAQITKFEQWLDICCELYNAALQERRDAWRISHKSIKWQAQSNQLPEIRAIRPEVGLVYAQVLQNILRRLNRNFDAFFRRVKAGEKPGYPRFRSRSRYNSFTYPQASNYCFSINKCKLKLSKLGQIKIKQHRPIEGQIKTITIMRSTTGKWYACIAAKVEAAPLAQSSEQVGIDCGLNKLAALSTGEIINNPRFFRADEKRLAKAQKRLSAAKKGSPDRKKRRKILVHIHERIVNKRRDFAHKESRKLVNRFAFIVFEHLNIEGMLKNHHLAKSIADAAWGQLVQFTTYKAEWAGRRVVQVNPRNTSQMCSGCGEIVKKNLSVRVHHCPSCGLVLDRDHNAAINILALGLQSIGQQAIEAAAL